VREIEREDGAIELVAGFAQNDKRQELLSRFALFAARWCSEPETDWVQASREAWPAREVGERLFLAPPWETAPTPQKRQRVIHIPGLACGTGEHPCTQLALIALERTVAPGSLVADIGTGSGLLAIAALRLGARAALALDIDEAALCAARENFALNKLKANLIAGSADCLQTASVSLLVANINASVLLFLADDLLRVVHPGGHLILTGFPRTEQAILQQIFSPAEILDLEGWSCLIARLS
jgi:ribosomal protein L11 methyltransferase